MDRDETGCQAPPEGPILCINNCGFFGSATTMNLCSKCHKDFILKQEQVKTAASSIESIVNGSSHKGKEPMPADVVAMKVDVVETNITPLNPAATSAVGESGEKETKRPNRCSSCKKRVGLTGFKCRCGNLFCATHRYSDKHDCSFDYQSAGKEAIAEANPVIKAEKLDKI